MPIASLVTIERLEKNLLLTIQSLDSDYTVENNIAIHKTAIIEKGVTLKLIQ